MMLLLAADPNRTEAAASESIRYRIGLGGMPIGRSVSVTPPDSGGLALRREESRIAIRRGDQEVRLTEGVVWTEESSGALRSVSVILRGMGPDPWSDRLDRVPGGWRREEAPRRADRGRYVVRRRFAGPPALERLLSSCRDSLRVRTVIPRRCGPRLTW